MNGQALGSRSKPALSLLFFWAATCLAILFLADGANAARAAGQPAALEEDDAVAPEDIGYDTIVNDLTREANRPAPSSKLKLAKAKSADPFDNVWIHFGVGVSNLLETVSFDDGKHAFIGQKGVQIAGGIDLFSPNWSAEGSYRGFGEAEDGDAHISLSEFELKLFYKNRYAKNLNLRGGGGLSGRYMNVRRTGLADVQYATPSSVLTFGADFFLNDNLSVGADLSARNSMISETVDRSSFDATLRVDTHF